MFGRLMLRGLGSGAGDGRAWRGRSRRRDCGKGRRGGADRSRRSRPSGGSIYNISRIEVLVHGVLKMRNRESINVEEVTLSR